jgi:hypothetical protein
VRGGALAGCAAGDAQRGACGGGQTEERFGGRLSVAAARKRIRNPTPLTEIDRSGPAPRVLEPPLAPPPPAVAAESGAPEPDSLGAVPDGAKGPAPLDAPSRAACGGSAAVAGEGAGRARPPEPAGAAAKGSKGATGPRQDASGRGAGWWRVWSLAAAAVAGLLAARRWAPLPDRAAALWRWAVAARGDAVCIDPAGAGAQGAAQQSGVGGAPPLSGVQ